MRVNSAATRECHLATLSFQRMAHRRTFHLPVSLLGTQTFLHLLSLALSIFYFILFWSCTLLEVTIATCHQLVRIVMLAFRYQAPEVGCFSSSAFSSFPITPGERGVPLQRPNPLPYFVSSPRQKKLRASFLPY